MPPHLWEEQSGLFATPKLLSKLVVRAQIGFPQPVVVFWGSQLGLEAPSHRLNGTDVCLVRSLVFPMLF